MPRNLVLFDLEWNIGYQPYTFNYHGVQQTLRGEIVEIGAVKIDEDANVLDTFSIHLRPRIFRKLQHHIAEVRTLRILGPHASFTEARCRNPALHAEKHPGVELLHFWQQREQLLRGAHQARLCTRTR